MRMAQQVKYEKAVSLGRNLNLSFHEKKQLQMDFVNNSSQDLRLLCIERKAFSATFYL